MLRRIWLAVASMAVLALLALPAAAGAVDAAVGAESDDPVVVLSGDVVVGPQQTVEGVYVASGDVTIRGHVTSDVVVLTGDVLVTGKIDGDLFTAGGTTRVEGAEIGGDVIYADERPDVSGDTLVDGEVKRFDWDDLGGSLFIGSILIWLAITISFGILGILLILLAPRAADALYARSRKRAGPTIGIGIAIAILFPVAAVVAAITVLGLPLAIGILLALGPVFCIAYAVSAWALGRRLIGPPHERLLAFLAGLAILRVAELVPIVGFLVTIAATIFGLGLIGAAIGAARKDEPDSEAPPPSAQIPDN